MDNENLRYLELKSRFKNHLFLIFKEGFTEILNLFDGLKYEKQKLITDKLAELNRLIEQLNQENKEGLKSNITQISEKISKYNRGYND